MRNDTKRFFASYATLIPLQTGADLVHGYSFVWDKTINQDVVDCMMQVCNDLDVKFGTQRDKDAFIDELTQEAVEMFILWNNTYDDFDISTPAGRDEFFQNLFCEAKQIAKEYGYDEDEQEQMRCRDEKWSQDDWVCEKDLNVLRSFSNGAEF